MIIHLIKDFQRLKEQFMWHVISELPEFTAALANSHPEFPYWNMVYMHQIHLETKTIPFTLHLQGKKVPFELELIGHFFVLFARCNSKCKKKPL